MNAEVVPGAGMHASRRTLAILERVEAQGTIEMALTITLLMTMLLAVIDFTYIFQAYIGVVSAANQGATYASANHSAAIDTSGISEAALGESDTWHCASVWVVSTTSQDAYGYEQANVTVHCRVADLIAVPGSLTDNIELSNTSVRRVRS